MKLETVPLIAAVVVALLGVALLLDATLADYAIRPNEGRRERRRTPRPERSRGGEMLMGIGVLALAAALAGRDSWRYSILATIAGAVLVLWGGFLNRRFLATVVSNRGPLRRRDPGAGPATPRPPRTPPPPPRGASGR